MLRSLTPLSPPLQHRLTRRQFMHCLGLGSLTLAGTLTPSAQAARSLAGNQVDRRESPVSAQDAPPRMVNGWLLRESDI
ncbi:hypothetical protein MHM84_12440 [Halomonas sp. McH1-25]|uniref:hypothetical protein n=1 Tax=unclassified Halomonas TaxID=2609666 RepID=UPI001EF6B8F4|nr:MULTISPECIES: hypothetical protein [unclassified Halomonas]MCG7600600.1 hypothetical protein [Halomonas sp. McH1-25]MCP1343223.1 hypothetical protein [Halomonas sp. FL8]MCP1359919.1 hypothetical protein [Halomonas sp. BBD45]